MAGEERLTKENLSVAAPSGASSWFEPIPEDELERLGLSSAPQGEAQTAASSQSTAPTGAGGGTGVDGQEEAPERVTLGSFSKGLAAGALRAPAAVLGGTLDLSNDVGSLGGRMLANQLRGSRLEKPVGDFARSISNSAPIRAFYNVFDNDANGISNFKDVLTAEDTVGRIGNDAVNDISTEVLGVIGGFGLARKGLQVSTNVALRKLGESAARGNILANATIGAAVDFATLSADEETIANIASEKGVLPEFLSYLAVDDDDGALESRFKNVLEGAFIGAALDTSFKVFKLVKLRVRGKDAEAAKLQKEIRDEVAEKARADGFDPEKQIERVEITPTATAEDAVRQNLDESFATMRSMQLQEGIDPAAAASEGGRKADVKGPIDRAKKAVDKATGPADKDIAEDANRLLESVGAEERLKPGEIKVSSDGRIIVADQATKDLLDDAGAGRAFITEAAADTAEKVIFKAGNAAGDSAIVGTMGKADLSRFSARVKALAEGVDPLSLASESAAGQIKLDGIGATRNVDAIARGIVDSLGEVKRTKSDDTLKAQIAAAKDAIGQDSAVIEKVAQQIAGDTEDLDVAVIVLREMWTASSKQIESLVDVDWANATPEFLDGARTAIHNALTLGHRFVNAKSNLGRGLRALQIPSLDQYVASSKARVAAGAPPRVPDAGAPFFPETTEEIQDWLSMWKYLGADAKGKANILEGMVSLPSASYHLRQSLGHLFTANILSAPRTVALNLVGPSLVSGIRTLERTAGGYLRALTTTDKAARATAIQASHAAARSYVSTIHQMRDAVRWGMKALKENRQVIGGRNSLNDLGEKFANIDGSVRDAARKQGADVTFLGSQQAANYTYALGNALNIWPRFFNRINNGLDEFAKRMSYMGEVRMDALLEAEERGLVGAEAEEFVKRTMNDSFDDTGAATNDFLFRQAEKSTFTGQVGEEGTNLRNFANAVNQLRQDYPEMRAILPIFNVPANSLGETLRRIPGLGFAFKEAREELMGERGIALQNEAYGRMLTGAAFMTVGYGWAKSGVITGSGPKDPRARGTWLAKYKPYSIRIGDQWVDYSRYDIAGTLLSIPADVFDRTVYRAQDEGFSDVMSASAAALAEFFRERAALNTVSELMAFGSQGSNDAKFLERLAGSTISGLTTPNFLTATLRNTTDQTLNVKAGVWDRVLDRMPWASQNLENLTNIFGEDIYRAQDTLLEGVIPLTAEKVVSWEDDPVVDELARLYESSGYAVDGYYDRRLGGGQLDARAVKLSSGYSLSYEYQKTLEATRIGGATLKESLLDLFESDRYLDAVDADASNIKLSTGDESRGALVAKRVSEYRQEAKRQLVRNNDEAARILAVADIKKAAGPELAGVTTEFLLTEDGDRLLLDLGIDIEEVTEKVRNK